MQSTLQAQAVGSPGAAEQLLQQISQDLGPFRDGISQNMVEQVYCSQFDPGFRVQIINNRVYIAGEAALGRLVEQHGSSAQSD